MLDHLERALESAPEVPGHTAVGHGRRRSERPSSLIGMVRLLVRDYDEAKAWFTTKLGFAVVDDRPMDDGKRWVVVAPPGAETRLLLARAPRPSRTARIGDQTGGRVFLFLETDDFERDFRAMTPAASNSARPRAERTTDRRRLRGPLRQSVGPDRTGSQGGQSEGARRILAAAAKTRGTLRFAHPHSLGWPRPSAKDSAVPSSPGAAVADAAESRPAEETCPKCLKPRSLCVCDEIVPIDNRVALLGAAASAGAGQDARYRPRPRAVAEASRVQGRPVLAEFAKALGRPAEPRNWAVVYLGSTRPADFPPGREVAVFDRRGNRSPTRTRRSPRSRASSFSTEPGARRRRCGGGTVGAQGEAIALKPKQPSLYGKLRREPRREGLSTLESAALFLSRLEEPAGDREDAALDLPAHVPALPRRPGGGAVDPTPSSSEVKS